MPSIVLGEFKPTYNERQAAQNRYLDQIASQRRVETAGRDASAFAISTRLGADTVALSAAASNASTSQAILSVAQGGLASSVDILKELKSVATLANSGLLSTEDRAALNTQFQNLLGELDSNAAATRFNGKSLLDGTSDITSGVSIALGANAGETISLSVPATTTATLGLTGANLLDGASTSAALDAIDTALQRVTSAQSEIGGLSSRFSFSADLIDTARENIEAAASTLVDADAGESFTAATAASLLNEANIAAQKKSNDQRRNLLALLQ